jgi:hypothetical protein
MRAVHARMSCTENGVKSRTGELLFKCARRGEPLAPEDEDAFARWKWPHGVAQGRRSRRPPIGTFGLGVTLSGLVFGPRWRKS